MKVELVNESGSSQASRLAWPDLYEERALSGMGGTASKRRRRQAVSASVYLNGTKANMEECRSSV